MDANDNTQWKEWLVSDQRHAASRPDVLVYTTDVLTEPVKIAGQALVNLVASTSGTDADWVVKLIDVYPAGARGDTGLAGYELMVAGDILRGRYRTSFEHPAPLTPGAVLSYTVDMHQQAYTFRRGHRIMVQVQSTWFPLYDRNPQTFVANIFKARASDYRAQTHRVFRTTSAPSGVEIHVLR